MPRGLRRLVSFFVMIAALFVVGMGMQFYDDVVKPALNPPTATPRPTWTTGPSRLLSITQTVRALQFGPAPDDCYRWDQITSALQGRTICFVGVITSVYDTPGVATRYEFSDAPNTFFLYSNGYEYLNPITGKAIRAGECIYLEAQVQVLQGVPFMSLDAAHQADKFKVAPGADCP